MISVGFKRSERQPSGRKGRAVFKGIASNEINKQLNQSKSASVYSRHTNTLQLKREVVVAECVTRATLVAEAEEVFRRSSRRANLSTRTSTTYKETNPIRKEMN